ncbi:hypothetical protein [Paenibacillus terrae]|nr:hypothetical protein [Paenibacillus terrae]
MIIKLVFISNIVTGRASSKGRSRKIAIALLPIPDLKLLLGFEQNAL